MAKFEFVDKVVAIRKRVDAMTEAEIEDRLQELDEHPYLDVWEIVEITYITDKINGFRP